MIELTSEWYYGISIYDWREKESRIVCTYKIGGTLPPYLSNLVANRAPYAKVHAGVESLQVPTQYTRARTQLHIVVRGSPRASLSSTQHFLPLGIRTFSLLLFCAVQMSVSKKPHDKCTSLNAVENINLVHVKIYVWDEMINNSAQFENLNCSPEQW